MFFNKKQNVSKISSIECNQYAEDNLSNLKRLMNLMPTHSSKYKIVWKEYYARKSGVDGEKYVLRTLQFSNIPMYILHDISFTNCDNGLISQIDFILVTQGSIILLECKNLSSKPYVKIDGKDFFKSRNHCDFPEPIRSPFEQGHEHLKTISSLLIKYQNRFLGKKRDCQRLIKSLCVFTGDDVYINRNKAHKDVSDSVVRIDRLCDKLDFLSSKKKFSSNDMYEIIEFLELFSEPPERIDWFERFNISNEEFEEFPIYQKLKSFRTKTYKNNKIKAYEVFNNAQIITFIKQNPMTLNELKLIPNFSEDQIMKYGKQIINILNTF